MQYHNAQFNCDPVALKRSKRVFRIHIMMGIMKCCVYNPSVYTLSVLLGLQATHAHVTCHYWNDSTASLSQDDSRRPHVVCQREQTLWGVKYRTIVLDATYSVSTLTFTACEVIAMQSILTGMITASFVGFSSFKLILNI